MLLPSVVHHVAFLCRHHEYRSAYHRLLPHKLYR
ncbi:hypothetical protein J968_4522, partial [Acinetobacter baumannii 26016_2]